MCGCGCGCGCGVQAEIEVGGLVHALSFAVAASSASPSATSRSSRSRALAATAQRFCSDKASLLGLAPDLPVQWQLLLAVAVQLTRPLRSAGPGCMTAICHQLLCLSAV